MSRYFKALVILIFLQFTGTIFAVTTSFIENKTIEDFENGTFKNVTLDINGHLSFSPNKKEIFSKKDTLYVWSSAKDKKGNIYFGTGNKPVVYKSYKGQAKLLYKHDSGLSISSLSVDSKNNIYASIVPDGTIIKITPKGSASVFAKLKDTYIWKIAHDKKDNLYAVTGSNAALYKITKNARIKKLFSSKNETNFLCLAIDKQNNLIFGSGEKGILYKFNAKTKKVKVLFDTYENEIKDIVLSKNGDIYFATATKIRKYPPPTFDYRDSFVIYGSFKNKASGKQAKKMPLKNSIYRLTRKGKVEKLLTLNEVLFLSLAIDKSGNLYSGSSDKGIIYKIEGVNKASVFVRTDELYVLSLLINKRKLIATTGNIGKVFNISLSYSKSGKYTSRVFDTKSEATWGLAKWSGSDFGKSKVSLNTRTGNTIIPDNTWSVWSKAYTNSNGSYIQSPLARYIQYKIVLKNKTNIPPVIHSVSLSYLPSNRAPTIDNITLVKDTPLEHASYDINSIPPNNFILKWEALDQDKDFLTYKVYFREKQFNNWILLKDDIDKNELSFDTRKLPDGKYYFKVVASDKKSNTEKRAKIANGISALFKIDNSPPTIKFVKIRKRRNSFYVEGKVQDKLSNIKSIHYSLNSREWVYINPKDLIYDNNNELFRLKINGSYLMKEGNTLIIRSADEFDNFTSYETSFKIRRKKALSIK